MHQGLESRRPDQDTIVKMLSTALAVDTWLAGNIYLCLQTRTNPAMTSVSGYTFCYPCLFNFMTREQCCPVTRIPASIDSIRRLYQST